MIHSSFALLGGAEKYVRDLSRDLTLRGHEVRVFCRPSANSHPGDQHVGSRFSARVGARSPVLQKVLTHLGDVLDPTGLRVRDLRDFNPDVVHVHNWQGLGALPIARLSAAYPTCHTVHDYAICDPNNTLANRGRSMLLDFLMRIRSAWLVRQLQRVVLLWPAERTRDIACTHVPRASRITGRIVPLAVSTAGRGRPTWLPGRKDVFLFLGALSPHKGIDMLLEAWRAKRGPVGTLLVAGDGARRGEVEEAARMDSSIRYLGYLDESGKESAMQCAGWLIFPSQWAENFPISCIEALIAERPIISSTIARPPIASDTSIVTFRDQQELSDVLGRAARLSEEEYEHMSSSAAADGRRLDWDRHVDTVVVTYEALRGTRGAPPPGADVPEKIRSWLAEP